MTEIARSSVASLLQVSPIKVLLAADKLNQKHRLTDAKTGVQDRPRARLLLPDNGRTYNYDKPDEWDRCT